MHHSLYNINDYTKTHGGVANPYVREKQHVLHRLPEHAGSG